jgi:hypothetical protein
MVVLLQTLGVRLFRRAFKPIWSVRDWRRTPLGVYGLGLFSLSAFEFVPDAFRLIRSWLDDCVPMIHVFFLFDLGTVNLLSIFLFSFLLSVLNHRLHFSTHSPFLYLISLRTIFCTYLFFSKTKCF